MNPALYLLSWFSGLASHKCRCPSMTNSSSPPSVLNTASPFLVKGARPHGGPRRDRVSYGRQCEAGTRVLLRFRVAPRVGLAGGGRPRHRLPPQGDGGD